MMLRTGPVLLGLLTLLVGCRTTGTMTIPQRRPADFTLGVVVYCDHAWEKTEECPARYIVEADGTMRASVGDGSGPLTHPPINRRLDQATMDHLWDLTHDLSVFTADETGPHPHVVHSPETYFPGDGAGYLIEIRSLDDQSAWAMPKDDPTAWALVRELAELSWVKP